MPRSVIKIVKQCKKSSLLYFLLLVSLLISFTVNGQDYTIEQGEISRSVFKNYLNRSLLMGSFASKRPKDNIWASNLQLIKNTKPKLLFRGAGDWYYTNIAHKAELTKASIDSIHNYDSDIIVELYIPELIVFDHFHQGSKTKQPIPSWVFDAFKEELGYSTSDAYPDRGFNWFHMIYADHPFYERNRQIGEKKPRRPRTRYFGSAAHKINSNLKHALPDISRLETQMFLYYFACLHIDAGCEMINFGGWFLINDEDALQGHKGIYSLIQKLRTFAATRNRGILLVGAQGAANPAESPYYDPSYPIIESDTCNRILLFDVTSGTMRIRERGESYGPFGGDADLYDPSRIPNYGLTKKGKYHYNWPCEKMYWLAEFDNMGYHHKSKHGKCGGGSPWVWGFDEITWLMTQSHDYREAFIAYAFKKIPTIDSLSILALPGSKNIHSKHNNSSIFYTFSAANGSLRNHKSHEHLFKRLWNQKEEQQNNQCAPHALKRIPLESPSVLKQIPTAWYSEHIKEVLKLELSPIVLPYEVQMSTYFHPSKCAGVPMRSVNFSLPCSD